MPKFTLIAEHTDNYGQTLSKTTHEFDVEFLPEVLENVDLFLRGTGFIPSGNLEYVEETFEDYDTQFYGDGHDGMGSTLDDYPELQKELRNQHSEFYFDTGRNK